MQLRKSLFGCCPSIDTVSVVGDAARSALGTFPVHPLTRSLKPRLVPGRVPGLPSRKNVSRESSRRSDTILGRNSGNARIAISAPTAALTKRWDLPRSLEPSSLTVGEAGDLQGPQGNPPQTPCFSRPGPFFGPTHRPYSRVSDPTRRSVSDASGMKISKKKAPGAFFPWVDYCYHFATQIPYRPVPSRPGAFDREPISARKC